MDRHIPQDGLGGRTEVCRYVETVPSDAGPIMCLSDPKVPVQMSALYDNCVRTVLHGDDIVEGVLARASQRLTCRIHARNQTEVHQVLQGFDDINFGQD